MANEINVDLRLRLDKLRQDARRAGSEVNRDLASSVRGLPATTQESAEQAAAAQASGRARRLAVERQRRNAAMDLADSVEEATRRNRARQLIRQRQGDREDREQQKQEESHRQSLVALGKAGAFAVAAFFAVAKALEEAAKAADRARRTYASALQSGFGVGMTVRREQLSNVLGVSEDQVWRYGAAISFLNGKLDWSGKILTETNPTLTALGWNVKIVEQNFAAMAAQITESAAPALNSFLDWLTKVAKTAAEVGSHSQTFQQNQSASTIEKMTEFLTQSRFKNQMGAIFDRQAGKWDFQGNGRNVTDSVQKTLEGQFSRFQAKNPVSDLKAPPPTSFMNQLPAAAWERMGLVIGGGGGVNYGQQTANNTKKLVDILLPLMQGQNKNSAPSMYPVTIPSLP